MFRMLPSKRIKKSGLKSYFYSCPWKEYYVYRTQKKRDSRIENMKYYGVDVTKKHEKM